MTSVRWVYLSGTLDLATGKPEGLRETARWRLLVNCTDFHSGPRSSVWCLESQASTSVCSGLRWARLGPLPALTSGRSFWRQWKFGCGLEVPWFRRVMRSPDPHMCSPAGGPAIFWTSAPLAGISRQVYQLTAFSTANIGTFLASRKNGFSRFLWEPCPASSGSQQPRLHPLQGYSLSPPASEDSAGLRARFSNSPISRKHGGSVEPVSCSSPRAPMRDPQTLRRPSSCCWPVVVPFAVLSPFSSLWSCWFLLQVKVIWYLTFFLPLP